MKNLLIATAVAAALSYLPAGANAAASPNELAQIREQLEGLMQRVDKLEQENTALKSENQTLKAQGEDLKAQDDYLKGEARNLRKEVATQAVQVNNTKGSEWASRVAVTADMRYRYEFIGDEAESAPGVQATADRYRDRVRARVNIVGRPTDNITLGVGLATTENNDPRSSNQSLTGVFSRKALDLDMAYFDWKFASWGNLVGGKMRQPFVKAGQSLLIDNDINPEGLAFVYNRGIFFASAYNFWLTEVSGAENTKTSDIMMQGAQFGARLPIGASTLTLAAHYYDLSGAEGRTPYYVAPGATLGAGNANGNTVCTVPALPALPIAACTGAVNFGLQNDYNVAELMAQFNTTAGSLPLQFWATAAQNQDADDLDTAWAAGFLVGTAQNYRTWEFGVNYHSVEKDSIYGQLFDSDFGGGVTDTQGFVIRGGYAPIRNWVLNATYFLNQRNVDVAGPLGKKEIDYDRLQLDFNVRF